MKFVVRILALFLSLAPFSFTFGADIQPPFITVSSLFTDLTISPEIQGWTWHLDGSDHNIVSWSQHSDIQDKLIEMNEDELYILTHPLHKKPILVTEETADKKSSFFEGLSSKIPRDGSFMGYKYVLIPQSVILPSDITSDDLKVRKAIESPAFFYLTAPIPANLDGTEFQEQPDNDEIGKLISRLTDGHVKYHKAYNASFPRPTVRYMFKQSANLGNPQAQYVLANMLQEGEGGEKDLGQARKYYRLSADQGHRYAQRNVAYMFRYGEGGDRDLELARHYYQLSADQEDPAAQFTYAGMLQFGLGGETYLPGARYYYQHAADQGLAAAQYELALMFRYGEGGDIRLDLARRYLQLSADQGYELAQKALDEMLRAAEEEGEGGGDPQWVENPPVQGTLKSKPSKAFRWLGKWFGGKRTR